VLLMAYLLMGFGDAAQLIGPDEESDSQCLQLRHEDPGQGVAVLLQ
jgi:hypothetical protein